MTIGQYGLIGAATFLAGLGMVGAARYHLRHAEALPGLVWGVACGGSGLLLSGSTALAERLAPQVLPLRPVQAMFLATVLVGLWLVLLALTARLLPRPTLAKAAGLAALSPDQRDALVGWLLLSALVFLLLGGGPLVLAGGGRH